MVSFKVLEEYIVFPAKQESLATQNANFFTGYT